MNNTDNRCDPKAALERLGAYTQSHINQSDLSKVLGVSRAAITLRKKRGSLPEPTFKLGCAYVWEVGTIKSWLTAWSAKKQSLSTTIP